MKPRLSNPTEASAQCLRLLLAGAVLAGGCAVTPPEAERGLRSFAARDVLPALEPVATPVSLKLRDALALALAHSPDLAALALEVEARDGEKLQAGLLPNPRLSIDAENFGRSRMRLGQLNGPEYTLALGQLVELGGKRAARVRAAGHERALSLWDYEAARVELLARTARDFVAVLAAQEQATLAGEGLRVSEQTAEAVGGKVAAGKVSPLETTRARVGVSRSRLEVDRAAGELAAARARLAANWGSAKAGFEHAAGVLSDPEATPGLERLQEELVTHPMIARWQDEVKRREAELKLARAKRIPDPTVSAGARFLDETDESGFVVGLSVPLPTSDRNQGGIQAAELRMRQAVARQRAAFINQRAALTVAYEEARGARRRVTAIERDILPAARTALDGMREAYQQGKIGLTDVLATERAWFEVKNELLAALRDYHAHRAELESLVGMPLSEIGKKEKTP